MGKYFGACPVPLTTFCAVLQKIASTMYSEMIYLSLAYSSLRFCFSSAFVLLRCSIILCKFLCFLCHPGLQELLTSDCLDVISVDEVNMERGAATGVSITATDVVAPVVVHVSGTATAVNG